MVADAFRNLNTQLAKCKIDDDDCVMETQDNIVTSNDECFDLVKIDISNQDLLHLCYNELGRTYPAVKNKHFWPKTGKEMLFLINFKGKLYYCQNTDSNAREHVGKKVISKIEDYYKEGIVKMYDEDFEMFLKPYFNYVIVSSKSFNLSNLANSFNKLLKMIGFVLKMKPRPDYDTCDMEDSTVQEMFPRSATDRGKYFFFVFTNTPDYIEVFLDDWLLSKMIEVLVRNLTETPKCTSYLNGVVEVSHIHGINAPHCLNVINASCAKLQDLLDFSFFAQKWNKFIFEE